MCYNNLHAPVQRIEIKLYGDCPIMLSEYNQVVLSH